MISGVPAVTVKAFAIVATSLPVVTVMVRAPTAAAGSMFSVAVALVAELIVSVATVIPAPKLAVVAPWTARNLRTFDHPVPIAVNGQEVRFLVDTGASAVALTPGDAQRLGFEV